MSEYNLSERERTVLAVLIDHFIRTAEPVGSRVLVNRYRLGVSPATIRNTLADLEERGLVEQPHTSAGRVPTEQGYRLYIDRLLKTEKLSSGDRDKIRRQLSADFNAIEEILEQTSRVLAQVSSQLGVTLSPKFEQASLSHIDVVQVTDTKLLVIIAVKGGAVRTILVEVESAIEVTDIADTVQILNEKLCGLSLGEIRDTIGERLKEAGHGNPQLIKLFIEQQESLLQSQEHTGLHTDGATNIVAQKEFQDPHKLKDFLSLLEERKTLIHLLHDQSESDGIKVIIGGESKIDNMKGVSAVTTSYSAGKVRGTVGIIGPTRMEYSKLIAVVDYTAKVLSEILSR